MTVGELAVSTRTKKERMISYSALGSVLFAALSVGLIVMSLVKDNTTYASAALVAALLSIAFSILSFREDSR